MSVEAKSPSQPVIRDRNFARRIELATRDHPASPKNPSGNGRDGYQKFLRERIEAQFKTKVSPEGVRKWFSGEARPRRTMMTMIAQALEVDEAWLAIGVTPTSTPEQKRQQSIIANGAIHVVAGLIQMNKGHIVFPEGDNETVDLYGIIGGYQKSFVIRDIEQIEGQIKIAVPAEHDRSVVIVVVQDTPVSFKLVRLPTAAIVKHGVRQGGYYEIEIDYNGQNFRTGGEVLPLIKSFSNLDGEIPARR